MTDSAYSGANMSLTCEGDLLAGRRNLSIGITQALIDKTSADDSRKGSYLPGRRDVSISIEMLYIYSDVGKKVLCNHVLQGSPSEITCIVTMPDGITYTGEALVESIDFNGPYEDATTATATLKITDGLTESSS